MEPELLSSAGAGHAGGWLVVCTVWQLHFNFNGNLNSVNCHYSFPTALGWDSPSHSNGPFAPPLYLYM